MIVAHDVSKLFQWFKDKAILNRNAVSEKSYMEAIKDLNPEDLRVGCEAMQRAKFQVMLTPQDFRSLCAKQWVPALRDRRVQAVAEMRRILGRRA